ncbi:MAG TPA: ATP-dependent DNA helicase [Gammaproteobacteria bacterium]
MPELADVFSPTGALARRLPGFTYREAQERMAGIVADAVAAGEHVAIEAGTGIGKTFAYLVPALLSGRRVIVSTGTRTLQDQLYRRDLPLLGRVLGRPVDVALLKGRNNYLCRHRLELALRGGTLSAEAAAALETVRVWSNAGGSGDLGELEDLPEDDPLRGWITSTVDNCLGGRCELFDRCFVLAARRAALAAQVVIVNHHLLLADLALKESGFGELLPGAEAVVVDEAHLLPDIAQQFYGVGVSSRELELLARDAVAEARAAAAGTAVEAGAEALVAAAGDVRIAAGREPAGRVPWAGVSPELAERLGAWTDRLAALEAALVEVQDAAAGLARLAERCRDASARLGAVLGADAERGLRWLDRSPRAVSAHWTPLDVGASLSASIEAQGGAWVFASATLAVGDDFSHFLKRIGLPRAASHVLPSPFDYRRNARLYLPQGLPDPSREGYVDALLHAVWPIVEAAGGGAFLLFTSYRALHAAQAWIELREAPGPVLVQGTGPRNRLLERFRADGSALLLGTGSFWQGVDVRGPALRVVVIDKLPFAVPSDPLVQARLNAIRRDGGDPFVESQLPEAVLALKQGVGRLIRDFDDRGLIVLGDPRIRTRPYGRAFVDSLPEMPLIDELDEAIAFAQTLRSARPELVG